MRFSGFKTALLLSPFLLRLGSASDDERDLSQPTGAYNYNASTAASAASVCKQPAVTPFVNPYLKKTKKSLKKRTGKAKLVLVRNLLPRQASDGTVEYCAYGADCKKIEIHQDHSGHRDPIYVTLEHHGHDEDAAITMTPKPISSSKIVGAGTLTTSYTTTKVSYSFKPQSSGTNPSGGKVAGSIIAGAAVTVVAIDATGEEITVAILEEGSTELADDAYEEEDGSAEEEDADICKLDIKAVSEAAENLFSTLRSMGASALKSYLLAAPTFTTSQPPKPTESPVEGVTCKTDGKLLQYNWFYCAQGNYLTRFKDYGLDDKHPIYHSIPLTPQDCVPDPDKPPKPWPKDGDRIFYKISRVNGPNCPDKVLLAEHKFMNGVNKINDNCVTDKSKPRTDWTIYGGTARGDCWLLETWGISNSEKETDSEGLGWRAGS